MILCLTACGAPAGETDQPTPLPILSTDPPTWYVTEAEPTTGEQYDLCPWGQGYLLAAEDGVYMLDGSLTRTEEASLPVFAAAITAGEDGPVYVTATGSGWGIADQSGLRYEIQRQGSAEQLLCRDGVLWYCDGFRLLRDGKALALPQSPEEQWRAAALVEDGEDLLAVLVRQDQGQYAPAAWLVPVDGDTAALAEAKGQPLPEAVWNISPCCAPESGCLCAEGKVWRLEAGSLSLLADLNGVGVSASVLRRVLVTASGDILCLEERSLTRLSQQPPESPSEDRTEAPAAAAEKQTLRLGILGSGTDLNVLFSHINRADPIYRIEYKLFQEEETLNLAILAGELDLICVSDPQLIRNYAGKSLLEPLDELAPDLLASETLYQNTLDALKTEDRLYELPITLQAYVCALPKSYGPEPETLSELLAQLTENEPPEYSVGYDFGMCWLPWTIDYWVDREQGIVRFDTPEFVELLEFSRRGEESRRAMDHQVWDPYFDAHAGEARFTMNQTLMVQNNVQWQQCYYYRLPFPGVSAIAMRADSNLAFLRGQVPEAARHFVELLLTDEGWYRRIQTASEESFAGYFYLNREWSERALRVRMDRKMNALYPVDGYDEAEFLETMEQVRKLLAESHQLYIPYTPEVLSVCQEEIAAFFNGDITAQEAARRIQSRVEIFLAERG